MRPIQLILATGVLLIGALTWSRIVRHGNSQPYPVITDAVPREAVTIPSSTEATLNSGFPAGPNPEPKAEEPPREAGSNPITPPGKPKWAVADGKDSTNLGKKNSASALRPAAGVRAGKEPPRDPVAREALYFVGADPAAEEYWLEAINDPDLSGQERQDLIEDLNEDGLSDPHHPTVDDLPLIMNRIALLEEVGQTAMDEVNADAFQEAYKDLVNLARAASVGEAVP